MGYDAADVGAKLAALYERHFGGRNRGRYRISMKFMRQLAGRARLYPEDVSAIARALYERGYVLIDMESYCVVLSQKTFASYRRVNADCVAGDAS